jgi:ABC-type glycerol-3-phosphate transport system permease component
MSCKVNETISIFSNSLIQGAIVFAFLTFFFFTYVINVEKEEFRKQVNMVVDVMFERYTEKIKLVLRNKLAKAALYGTVISTEDDFIKSTLKETEELTKKNKEIILSSVKSVGMFTIATIFIIVVLSFYGYCVSFKHMTKEAIFILFFIFLVEFIFINLIAKNYISANPNYVKNKIARSIIDYANKKKINI